MTGAKTPLAVVGYGLWTAAGHDGPTSVAAMASGTPGSTQTTLWDFTVGATLQGFRVNSH